MQPFRDIRCTPLTAGIDFPGLSGSFWQRNTRVFNQEIFNREGYKIGDKTHRPGRKTPGFGEEKRESVALSLSRRIVLPVCRQTRLIPQTGSGEARFSTAVN